MHVNEHFFNGLAFTPHEISHTLRQMQNTLENNGYPFSKVYLDNIKIEGTNLTSNVKIEKNEIYNWTEIHIKGDSSISNVFLSNIIRIKPGDKYSQQELKQINFLKEIKNHEVLFTKNGAELFL